MATRFFICLYALVSVFRRLKASGNLQWVAFDMDLKNIFRTGIFWRVVGKAALCLLLAGFGSRDIDDNWLPISDFLEKPVDFDVLLNKVDALLPKTKNSQAD